MASNALCCYFQTMGPYFQKTPWPPFVYNGQTYDLSHLTEFVITVADHNNIERKIAVTFEDHCFTRDPEPGDTTATIYQGCSRNPGHFCFDRYNHSLNLVAQIQAAALGQVKIGEGRENYVIVNLANANGQTEEYAVFFSLDKVKGLPVHLRMRVKSAYPATKKKLVTHGTVRFRMLVSLRMQNKTPHRKR